jgi:methylenetetrahydrofolate dehydrogenase (NADP+)/methenyltetrahydrofolate cyclohydrolase
MNQGLLQKGMEYASPCTPSGVMKLLDWTMAGFPDSIEALPRVSLAGKSAVVVGRSILVGKPVATMLLERNATVTIAHSKTPNLSAVCRAADILVVAVGVPFLVKGEFIKEGAIVLDVGINRLESGELVGDVAIEQAAPHAAAITPVPGGVGPMTVAMLMANTLSLRRQFGS